MYMTEIKPSYYAEDLACKDGERQVYLEQVVEKFAQGGADNLVGVFDFDKNMTKNGPGAFTSWDAASDQMSDAGRIKEEEMNQKYIALEERRVFDDKGEIIEFTQEHALAWWEETLKIYKQENINFNQMISYAGEKIALRKGVAELFRLFEQHNVPTVIVSAGLKAIIEEVTEKSGINPDLIISTDVETDDKGFITGWNPNTVVHNHNKFIRSREKMAGILAVRKNVLLTGDSFEDPKMVEETAENGLSVIRVRVGDPHNLTSRGAGYLDGSYDAGYNAVSVTGMEPVLRMSRYILGESIDETA